MPKVGLSPVVPQTVEGETILPNVSVPMAKGINQAETADALPAEEPLDPLSISHGFLVVPPNHTSPHANAPIDVLAIRTAPAAFSF